MTSAPVLLIRLQLAFEICYNIDSSLSHTLTLKSIFAEADEGGHLVDAGPLVETGRRQTLVFVKLVTSEN